MPALRKRLPELTADDLLGLIADQWPEDELLEFKRTLATAKGDADKWIVDQSEIGAAAKRDLLAAVVAMANSYGGDVVLGIEETGEKPPRAKALVALPRCVELAHRLELAARDLIKPNIPLLSMRGVTTNDGDSGVVVIRVPRSRLAPHRLEMKGIEKECYKRVRDRTEMMSMREIQDLTLSTARGAQGVEDRLEWLRSRFLSDANFDHVTAGTLRLGLRVSATPLSSDVNVERVHGVGELVPSYRKFQITFSTGSKFPIEPLGYFGSWRPLIRGTRAVEVSSEFSRSIELFCDGSLSFTYLFNNPDRDPAYSQRREHVVYPGWLLALFLNATATADAFRAFAGAASVEYAAHVELSSFPKGAPMMPLGDAWYRSPGSLPAGHTKFPTYSVSGPEGRAELLTVFWRDLWNACGVEANESIATVT